MISRYNRQRILHFVRMGYKPPTICRMLQEEGLIANLMCIHKFPQKNRETHNIERKASSGRLTKMTAAVKALVEQQMRGDNETTAVELHALLLRLFS